MEKQLTTREINQKIIGKTFYGKHPPNFEYIIVINSDGSLEGKNNCCHYDWSKWQLIDINTGQINTRLNQEIEAIKNNKAYCFEKA